MTARLSDVRLHELAELAANATPGPWKWLFYTPERTGKEPFRVFLEATGRDYRHVLKITWPELLRDEDAAFIAAAGTDLGRVVQELIQLRAERERSEIDKALDGPCDFWPRAQDDGWECGTCGKVVYGAVSIADACERLAAARAVLAGGVPGEPQEASEEGRSDAPAEEQA